MRVAAITCYTGDEEFAAMTDRMLCGFEASCQITGVDAVTVVVAQGATRIVSGPGRELIETDSNMGFAKGMNLAMEYALRKQPTHILCINNDVEILDSKWLLHLLQNAVDKVAVPTTNYTGQKLQEALGPVDREPFDVESTPAVCWLLPWAACLRLFIYSGGFGKLFREDIGMGWGEDGYAAAVLNKYWSENPFRIVPRAFVRHLGAKTSSLIPASERMESVRKSEALIKELK